MLRRPIGSVRASRSRARSRFAASDPAPQAQHQPADGDSHTIHPHVMETLPAALRVKMPGGSRHYLRIDRGISAVASWRGLPFRGLPGFAWESASCGRSPMGATASGRTIAPRQTHGPRQAQEPVRGRGGSHGREHDTAMAAGIGRRLSKFSPLIATADE